MKKLLSFLLNTPFIFGVTILVPQLYADMSEVNGYDITEILSFEESFTKTIGTLTEKKLISLSFNSKANKQILKYTPVKGPRKNVEQKILFFFVPLEDQENLSQFSAQSRKMIKKEQQNNPDSNYVLCILSQEEAPRGIQTFVAMDYFALSFCVFFRQIPRTISVHTTPSGRLTLESSEHNSITIPAL